MAKIPPATIGIIGPTASGKTAVAIALAARLGGAAEIVSVDSMQVYRHMDIGTAKPTIEEQKRAVFCAIDIVNPDEEFTLADYQAYAAVEIERIRAEDKTAILAGGTGLYFRALTTRLDIPITAPDTVLRRRWEQYAQVNGNPALHEELRRVDSVAASRIHVNDVRRTVRALEVYEKTGRALSDWHRENQNRQSSDDGHASYYCLTFERETLNKRINDRVNTMIDLGLADEVHALRTMGYGADLNSMRSIGYRQINEHCDGLMSLDEAIASTQLETRQFARRQLIWFRGDKRLCWIQADCLSIDDIVEQICTSANIN